MTRAPSHLFKSGGAIAAIIGDIVFFLQFKEFKLYWGAVLLRLEEEYWRSPFLIIFIGVIFEARNEEREKIWSDFVAEQNEEWSKNRVVFVHIVVSREQEIEV